VRWWVNACTRATACTCLKSARDPESCLAEVKRDSSRTGASSTRHLPSSILCTHTDAATFMKAYLQQQQRQLLHKQQQRQLLHNDIRDAGGGGETYDPSVSGSMGMGSL